MTQERVCGFSPGTGCQASESKEELSLRAKAPPLTIMSPDSGFAEERARPCALRNHQNGEGTGFTGALPQRGSCCVIPQVTRLLKTAEVQLIKCSFIVEII